jgi:hypothetical protein
MKEEMLRLKVRYDDRDEKFSELVKINQKYFNP